ncbi:manganese-binding lipoprotein MntA [Bacillus sp. J14TS2]|uniref:metal ABC transporter substrate-binding protein n=1 Tax=Bacillus sp. J14TS2 TaxID=2807188 RepID=UPI001B059318|nr:metal ABC transporter substrate-binding protein [Bacillus sp. J14TS2]GIN72122.1 manganese-binding lipoprotein MntA [Bacillus sp. J14TS2]
MKNVFKLGITALMALLLIVGCSSNDTGANDGSDTGDTADSLKVVTTYSILYDMVQEVGGDRVDVYSIVPIGQDPHEYDPLPEDVKQTADADMVFYNGLNLEEGNGWFDRLLETTDKDGDDSSVYVLSEGVEPKYLTTEGQENEQDPHAWLNIENGIKYVENARDMLIKEDPEGESYYTENADKYIEELRKLHDEAIERFEGLPDERKAFVTSEGAFKYFADAYGLNGEYIWEINTEDEGTPDQMKRITDIVKEQNIPALFVETSVDPRSMEALADETGKEIKGNLFTDSLGEAGEDGDTYYKMMEWNFDTIYDGVKE